MRTCDAAAAVLRETSNPAVMWGDLGLLDTIAERVGVQPVWPPMRRWKRVLDALSKQPGELIPGYARCGSRTVRIFYLPEHAR